MESHLQSRPHKTVFALNEQYKLREIAIDKIKDIFLPNDGIIKIILIGSSVKGAFGVYDPPGFRGSHFSDFDFIVFVTDDYQIPTDLEHEPDGKPFQDENLDLAYRKRKFVENIYDAEIFFIRESSLLDLKTQAAGERAGIPMRDSTTRHPFLCVYPSKAHRAT